MKTKLTKLKWKHFVFLSILSFSTNFVNASSKEDIEDISETDSDSFSGSYIEESSESYSGKSGEDLIIDIWEKNPIHETPKYSQPIYIPEVIYIEESPNNNNNNKRYEIQENEKPQTLFTEENEKKGRSDSDESDYELDYKILEESQVNLAKAMSLQEQNNKAKIKENEEEYIEYYNTQIREFEEKEKKKKEISSQEQNTKSKNNENEQDRLEYYNNQIREFEEKEKKIFTRRSQDLLSNYTKKNRLSPEKSLSNKTRENKK